VRHFSRIAIYSWVIRGKAICPERVRENGEGNAAGERTILPGTRVRVIGIISDWVMVARDGQKLGYVPAEARLQLQ